MPETRTLRRRALGAVVIASAVAAGALVPAAAATADDLTADFTGGLVDAGWTGPAATGSDYDFEVVDSDTLRASNWQASNSRGVITQLVSPATDAAGEPFYTDADDDTFTVNFTLDSAVVDGSSTSYDAQPGLAIELNADHEGNRAGAGVTLRIPEDGVLELSNYYSEPEDLGEIWRNDVATVDFDGPLNIQYQVHFVAGGKDVVTVEVDGEEVLTGGSYEGYTTAADGHAGIVDDVLLRAVSREPGASPSEASWNNITLTSEANEALKGNGFLFSDLSYGASSESKTDYSSTTLVQKSTIQDHEVSDVHAVGYNYNQWHVSRGGSELPQPTAYDVVNHQLVLTDTGLDGHSVQLLKGFDSGEEPTDLYALVAQGIAWDQPSTGTGAAHFQLPVYRDGNWAGTLYPVSPVAGHNVVSLGDLWKGTKTFAGYTANTALPLADIIAALGSDYYVSGFGVASSGDAPTTLVDSITFGDVKYTFASDAVLILNPVISGELKVGKVLTVAPNLNYAGGTFTYQWYRDGSAISNAKSVSYTLSSSDRAHAISVKVTAKKTGFSTVSKSSAKTAKIGYGTIVPTGALTITGTSKVGQKLTAVKPGYGLSSVSTTYQWYRGASAISGAKSSTYTLTSSDLGKNISVHVKATKTGYTALTLSSAATAAIDPGVLAVSKVPTIKGTAKVGKTLTASSSGWNVSSLTKKYWWYADGELVKVSTSNTLKLTWEEKGKHITVKVVGTKLAYLSAETGVSTATGVVK